MNELKIFNFNDQEVRTLLIDDEPYFVGKDVAMILGYSNTRDALNKHVDVEDKNTVAIHDGIKRGNPNQVVINESGLYSLILSSKLPTAKKFKRWVTSEVLPAIRKTGSYTVKAKSTEVERQLNRQIRKMYADNRRAELMMRLADAETTTRARKVELRNRAAMILIGPQHSYQEAYTAKYIADRTGVTPKMVGTIANLNHLKAEDGEANEYGHYEYVTNPVTGASYWQWYYNQEGVQRMEELIEGYYVEE